MNYHFLGATPLKVSEICYGTMTFSWKNNLKESEQIFNFAFDHGINFFDTAEMYGDAEEYLGKIIKGKRDKIILSSKVHGFSEPNFYQSRQSIKQTVERSLKLLKTDYIDIYFLHWLDPYTPFEEKLNALHELVKEGKIRYIGTSNHDAWLVEKMLNYADLHNLSPISVMQEVYNPVDYDISRERLSLAKNQNIGMMVYSPLAGGFLTGKYRKNNIPDNSRAKAGADWENKRWQFRFSEYGFKLLNLLEKIAEKYNATISQTTLSYLLSFQELSTLVVGSSNINQLEENLKIFQMETEDVNAIKKESLFLV